MSPEECMQGLHYFGKQGKIALCPLSRCAGAKYPSSHLVFIGEGNLDMFEVMKTLHDYGFNGFLIDDHVPMMDGDSGWKNYNTPTPPVKW